MSNSCTAEGCTREHAARGYCVSHYYHWRKNGAKLTEDKIVRIRERRAQGESVASIACDLDVTKSAIYKVVLQGVRWQHVE